MDIDGAATAEFIANITAILRDILLFALLLVLLVGALIVVKKLSALINEAQKVVTNTREMIETLTENVVEPAASNSGMAYGAGKVGAFLLGLRKNKRRKGDEDNGK